MTSDAAKLTKLSIARSTASDLEGQAMSLIDRLDVRSFIGGSRHTGDTVTEIEVLDPASQKPLAAISMVGPDSVDAAVSAALMTQKSVAWGGFMPSDRGSILMRLAALVERDAEKIALIECVDTGHTLASIQNGDIPAAISAIRENASWANKLGGRVPMTPDPSSSFAYSSREPIGVAGIITPWNAPFLMVVKKLSAALAAGCCVVVKPAELAPLSAAYLIDLIEEAGIPAGVVNIIFGHGHEAGARLTMHPDVRMISFTGSTQVGRSIVESSARSNLKRFVLELGGKSPVLVFGDADISAAAKSVAHEMVFKSGQYCGAGTRVYVDGAVIDEFTERLVRELSCFKIGPGFAPGVDFGPLISGVQRDRVASMVADGIANGAIEIFRGPDLVSQGFFHSAVVLGHTRPGMQVHDEEVFGPVVCLNTFNANDGLNQITEKANDNAYGLSAKVWSRDVSKVLRMTRSLESGTVVINGGRGEKALPFGGFKQSGFGRENGREGVEAFTELKTIRIGL